MESVFDSVEKCVPGTIQRSELDKYPQFARLLGQLFEQHLAADGASRHTIERMEQAELALRQKRRDYLKWQLLNTTLKEVLADAQAARRDSGGDERKLQAVDAVQQAVTQAEVTQYMSVPPDERAQPHAREMTLLGVGKAELHQITTFNNKQAARQLQQYILPDLENRLRERCQQLSSFYNPGQVSGGKKFALAKAHQLAGIVKSDKHWLEEARLQQHHTRLQVAQLRARCHQMLWTCLELLDAILVEFKLNSSTTDVHCQWLMARSQTLALKLRLFEQQLLADTYSPHAVAALTKIKHHLDLSSQETEAELVRTAAALQAYESLGLGFGKIVDEYNQLERELENKRWALAELQQSET